MYDKVINLVNNGVTTGSLRADAPLLLSRENILKQVESVFNMMLSLINDDSLMAEENIPEGYDLHIGRVNSDSGHSQCYGEIHTGDAWAPALQHHCGYNGKYMSLSLVVFGDKTHTDLHGSLSLTHIIFTLTCFDRRAINNPDSWRPLTYIPNLSRERGKSSKVESSVKVQDKHNCLALAFKPLSGLHRSKKGIRA